MRRMKGVSDPLVTPLEPRPGLETLGPSVSNPEWNIAHNLAVIAVRLGELTEAVHLLAAREKEVRHVPLFEAIFGKPAS